MERIFPQPPRLTSTPRPCRSTCLLQDTFNGLSPILASGSPIRKTKSLVHVPGPTKVVPCAERRTLGVITNDDYLKKVSTQPLPTENPPKECPNGVLADQNYTKKQSLSKTTQVKKSLLPSIPETSPHQESANLLTKTGKTSDLSIFKSTENVNSKWILPLKTKKSVLYKKKDSFAEIGKENTQPQEEIDQQVEVSLFQEPNIVSSPKVSSSKKIRKTYVVKDQHICDNHSQKETKRRISHNNNSDTTKSLQGCIMEKLNPEELPKKLNKTYVRNYPAESTCNLEQNLASGSSCSLKQRKTALFKQGSKNTDLSEAQVEKCSDVNIHENPKYPQTLDEFNSSDCKKKINKTYVQNSPVTTKDVVVNSSKTKVKLEHHKTSTSLQPAKSDEGVEFPKEITNIKTPESSNEVHKVVNYKKHNTRSTRNPNTKTSIDKIRTEIDKMSENVVVKLSARPKRERQKKDHSTMNPITEDSKNQNSTDKSSPKMKNKKPTKSRRTSKLTKSNEHNDKNIEQNNDQTDPLHNVNSGMTTTKDDTDKKRSTRKKKLPSSDEPVLRLPRKRRNCENIPINNPTPDIVETSSKIISSEEVFKSPEKIYNALQIPSEAKVLSLKKSNYNAKKNIPRKVVSKEINQGKETALLIEANSLSPLGSSFPINKRKKNVSKKGNKMLKSVKKPRGKCDGDNNSEDSKHIQNAFEEKGNSVDNCEQINKKSTNSFPVKNTKNYDKKVFSPKKDTNIAYTKSCSEQPIHSHINLDGSKEDKSSDPFTYPNDISGHVLHKKHSRKLMKGTENKITVDEIWSDENKEMPFITERRRKKPHVSSAPNVEISNSQINCITDFEPLGTSKGANTITVTKKNNGDEKNMKLHYLDEQIKPGHSTNIESDIKKRKNKTSLLSEESDVAVSQKKKARYEDVPIDDTGTSDVNPTKKLLISEEYQEQSVQSRVPKVSLPTKVLGGCPLPEEEHSSTHSAEPVFYVHSCLGMIKKVKISTPNPGVEIQTFLHIDNYVVVGCIFIQSGASIKKATTPTAYFVEQGIATVSLDNITRIISSQDNRNYFFIPKYSQFEITNQESITLKLKFTKFKG